MIDTSIGGPPSTNTDAIMAVAGEWIARREEAVWSPEDQGQLDAWLAASSSHMIAFLRLEDVWRRADRLKALKHPVRGKLALLKQWAVRPLLLRVAAIIAVVSVSTAIGMTYLSRSNGTAFETSIGGHKILTLTDGSTIELNTDTSIRLSQSGKNKVVKLEKGEAFFNIRHDPSRSFVVLAGGHRITDIGTQFVVRAESGRLDVELLEGRAKFDALGGRMQSPILLTQGVTLTVANNLITTSRKADPELRDHLAWRRGMIVFDKMPLREAAAEFSRYGGKKIVVSDNHIASIPVSATFPVNGAESFVELAKAMLGLNVKRHDDEIEITR